MTSSLGKEQTFAKRAWLLLSIEGKRQYAGNTGYADIAGKIYRFDSFVPNARHVRVDDLVVFRNRLGAFGFAVVQDIKSEEGTKDIHRCPVCNVAQIKERTTKAPRYRCKNKHEFDVPSKETRTCTKFEAHFGDTFAQADQLIPAKLVRGACYRFNGQLSIQPISLDIFFPFIEKNARSTIESSGLVDPRPLPNDADSSDNAKTTYLVRGEDSRKRVFRQIAERRGQKKFRDSFA